MRPRGFKKYALGAGGMLVLVMAILLATGWGTAVAAQISSVFVTNDAAHPVPVHEQGTANVNVTNTARVQAGIPPGAFSVQIRATGEIVSGPDAAETNYAITSFTAVNDQGLPGQAYLYGSYGPTPDCINGPEFFNTRFGPSVEVPPHATVHLAFPQPYVIAAKPEGNSCLFVSGNGENNVVITTMVVGYRM